MIFVGYQLGSKAYRVYNPTTGRVHISRDVIFNELAQWWWSGDEIISGKYNNFVIEYNTVF